MASLGISFIPLAVSRALQGNMLRPSSLEVLPNLATAKYAPL